MGFYEVNELQINELTPENLKKKKVLIWEKAIEYAYKQDVNLWKRTRNFVRYAIT